MKKGMKMSGDQKAMKKRTMLSNAATKMFGAQTSAKAPPVKGKGRKAY